ncbi:hypothetical protein K466DRAFT_149347 [Polyporus arcularius HHB13444]|uniref:Uncharacterized protein n=1 Tax=Polyporus arcularius HHB13444 TaxID=1314778 RepID=A0A5C3PKK6_9APHY|nr:hypothetical protein K466DRAFT_149347 [Polyporus arcularius HHB13444]
MKRSRSERRATIACGGACQRSNSAAHHSLRCIHAHPASARPTPADTGLRSGRESVPAARHQAVAPVAAGTDQIVPQLVTICRAVYMLRCAGTVPPTSGRLLRTCAEGEMRVCGGCAGRADSSQAGGCSPLAKRTSACARRTEG